MFQADCNAPLEGVTLPSTPTDPMHLYHPDVVLVSIRNLNCEQLCKKIAELKVDLPDGMKYTKLQTDDNEYELVLSLGLSPEALVAINLRMRSLGILSPGLNVQEWATLLRAYGISDEKVQAFVKTHSKEHTGLSEVYSGKWDLVEALSPLSPEQQDLVLDNLGLAEFVCQKYYGRCPLDDDELLSLARYGLIHAAASYDATKGVKFSTYAVRVIYNAINEQLSKNKTQDRIRSRLGELDTDKLGDMYASAGDKFDPSIELGNLR